MIRREVRPAGRREAEDIPGGTRLVAACELVASGDVGAVSITLPRSPHATAATSFAERIAAEHGLATGVKLASGFITIDFRREAADRG